VSHYSPVPELNLLKELEERAAGDFVADGFEMLGYDDPELLSGWPDDPAFRSRLIPFAQANGSGSVYALWRCDDREDPAALPVVVLGDEGALAAVAENPHGLVLLLGADSEIGVDHGYPPYLRGEPQDGNGPRRARYRAWLQEHFGRGLPTDSEVSAVLDGAQNRYGERFARWAGCYLPL
jgi:hypothetical protein